VEVAAAHAWMAELLRRHADSEPCEASEPVEKRDADSEPCEASVPVEKRERVNGESVKEVEAAVVMERKADVASATRAHVTSGVDTARGATSTSTSALVGGHHLTLMAELDQIKQRLAALDAHLITRSQPDGIDVEQRTAVVPLITFDQPDAVGVKQHIAAELSPRTEDRRLSRTRHTMSALKPTPSSTLPAMQLHSSPSSPTEPSTPSSPTSASVPEWRVRHAFLASDRDHSGALSKRELYHALALLGLHYTPSEQLRVWHACADSHGWHRSTLATAGGVSWHAFCTLAMSLLKEAFPRQGVSVAFPRQGVSVATPASVAPTAMRTPLARQREEQLRRAAINVSAHDTQVRRALAQRQRVGEFMGYPPPIYPGLGPWSRC